MLSTSITSHWMFFLCICIVYVRLFFFFFFFCCCCFFRQRFIDFFNIQVLSTSVPMYLHCIYSLHILKDVSDFFIHLSCMHLSTSDTHTCVVSLYISIVYVCHFEIYICFVFPKFDQRVSCLHLTISLLFLFSYTPLWCNQIRSIGNLLSFRALYDIF